MIIDKTVWELLEQSYQASPEIKCTNSTDEQISATEKELGIKFSDFYRYFLKYHQISLVGTYSITTLTESEKSPSNNWSVIDATKEFRHNMGLGFEEWYVVSLTESGDYVAINNKREVWVYYRKFSFGKEKIANDFEQFIHCLLTDNISSEHQSLVHSY